MQISLPPDLEQFVEEQVKTGHYPNPEAVVEDALTLLRHQPTWTHEDLKQEIDRGIEALERGDAVTLDEQGLRALCDDVKTRGRERIAKSDARQIESALTL
jgi:antitoxin ParD1/3/4